MVSEVVNSFGNFDGTQSNRKEELVIIFADRVKYKPKISDMYGGCIPSEIWQAIIVST